MNNDKTSLAKLVDGKIRTTYLVIKNDLENILFRDLLRIKELLEKNGDLKTIEEVERLIYNFELYFDAIDRKVKSLEEGGK